MRCATSTIFSFSDQRDKVNVSDLSYGLNFSESLRPVQFGQDLRELSEADVGGAKNGTKQVGFLAQEIQSSMTGDDNTYLNFIK